MSSSEFASCSSFCPVTERRKVIPDNATHSTGAQSTFYFVVIADPQFGLYEAYIEKLPPPHRYDRELKAVNRAVSLINRLDPKPAFVMVCGDMVHAEPGSVYRIPQAKDLITSLSKLNRSIPFFALPGNHDVRNEPSIADIEDYKTLWGDDYYWLTCNQHDFVVLNSQYLWNSQNCPEKASEFKQWMDKTLSSLSDSGSKNPIVFQHIPMFNNQANEPDDYFNIPSAQRAFLLNRFYSAGVRYVFSGHLHKNFVSSWSPDLDCLDPIHLITSSSVSVQLGSDKDGIQLVQVKKADIATPDADHSINAVYWSLDDLSKCLDGGKQPFDSI